MSYDLCAYLKRNYRSDAEPWTTLQDYLLADYPNPEEKLLMKEQMNILLECIEDLPPRQACVVIKRFGLGGEAPMTLAKIKKRLRYRTESSVYGALKRSIRNLSAMLVERKILKQDVDPHDVIHMFVSSKGKVSTSKKYKSLTSTPADGKI